VKRTAAWYVAIFIFALDQFTKFRASSVLELNQTREVVKNVFHLTLVHNSGAAFGIFRDLTVFFTLISASAIIAIGIYLKRRKIPCFLKDASLALILGGAAGNLADRLRFGYVVDFLDFRVWPVFNVADSAITVGVGLLIISLAAGRRVTGAQGYRG